MRELLWLVLALTLVTAGCRSVWIHPEWKQGRFEADWMECNERASGQIVTTKMCMTQRGWDTKNGFAWDDRSQPAAGSES